MMNKPTSSAEKVLATEEIKKIGQRIAFYRKQRNLTQRELAEKANVSKSYLSKIESSGTEVTFSLFLLYKLAEALEVKAYCLLKPVNEKYLYMEEDN